MYALGALLISFIFLATFTGKVYNSDIEIYKDTCETLDVTPVLKSDKIVTNFVKCLMEEGPCSGDGKKILKVVPEILVTTCGNCSPKQKFLVRLVMKHMYNKRRTDFDRLYNKFDPEQVYHNKTMAFMEEK